MRPELTPREIEVLQLAGRGCTGPMIAERLVVSAATVKTHFGNVYKKYGVSDRASAVARRSAKASLSRRTPRQVRRTNWQLLRGSIRGSMLSGHGLI